MAGGQPEPGRAHTPSTTVGLLAGRHHNGHACGGTTTQHTAGSKQRQRDCTTQAMHTTYPHTHAVPTHAHCSGTAVQSIQVSSFPVGSRDPYITSFCKATAAYNRKHIHAGHTCYRKSPTLLRCLCPAGPSLGQQPSTLQAIQGKQDPTPAHHQPHIHTPPASCI